MTSLKRGWPLFFGFVAFAIVASSLSFTVASLQVPNMGGLALPRASGNGTLPPLPSVGLRNYWNSSSVRSPIAAGTSFGGAFAALVSLFWNAILALVIGASVLGLLYLFKGWGLTNTKLPPVDRVEEQVEEFRKIIDRTVYSLNGYSGSRRTIIDCYRAIVALLKEAGWSGQASFTAREFEGAVGASLGISSKYLHELTSLFEFARYSVEELSPKEAEEAKSCLSGLSSELRTNSQGRGALLAT